MDRYGTRNKLESVQLGAKLAALDGSTLQSQLQRGRYSDFMDDDGEEGGWDLIKPNPH